MSYLHFGGGGFLGRARSILLGSFVALCAASLLGAVALHRAPVGASPQPKVLLIGVDAGEWDVLGPLLDKGKCPNLARMRNQGSSGKL